MPRRLEDDGASRASRNRTDLTTLSSPHTCGTARSVFFTLISSMRAVVEDVMRSSGGRLYLLMPDLVALRRLVAVLCATAFLVVGFAHSLHHFGSSVLTASTQSALEPPAGGLDSPNSVSSDNYHCHGCTMLATLGGESAAATLVAAEIPLFRLDAGQAHRAVVEPPPPKFAI
jgi:hypothetical protein